jgi:hypothetical protein
MFAIRLACEIITPRGMEVDPDVYWRNASEAGSIGAEGSGPSGPAGASVGSTARSRRGPASTPGLEAREAMSPVVRRTAGPQSAATAISESMVRSTCGPGELTGTATTPA